jgi:hypothetical protein
LHHGTHSRTESSLQSAHGCRFTRISVLKLIICVVSFGGRICVLP